MSLISNSARSMSKASINQVYLQLRDSLLVRENFSRRCWTESMKFVSHHTPTLTVDMSADTGAGDRYPQIQKRSCSVINGVSFTNHRDKGESRTPNCRQQGLLNHMGMNWKKRTNQHCYFIANHPVSHMLWLRVGVGDHTLVESRTHLSAFYFVLPLSPTSLSSLLAPLPLQPPHPVKHMKLG